MSYITDVLLLFFIFKGALTVFVQVEQNGKVVLLRMRKGKQIKNNLKAIDFVEVMMICAGS